MRVLVTCPPMLGLIEEFVPLAAELGIDLVPAKVVQILTEDELCAQLPAFDGWIIGDDPATARVFAAGKSGRLRAAMKWGVGVDNVDFAAAREMGVPISNTPGVFGAEVADIAMHYITALARETFQIDRGVRQHNWPKPRGISLAEKKVALVGYGDIGRQTARRLLAADMLPIVYDPDYITATGLSVDNAEWPDRIGEVDFIVFTCPLTPETSGMFNETLLNVLKPGIRVINVSRGPVVRESALVAGFRSGVVHSAALDVFEEEPLPDTSPLRDIDRCLFGSHNASNTEDAVRRVSKQAVTKIADFLQGWRTPKCG